MVGIYRHTSNSFHLNDTASHIMVAKRGQRATYPGQCPILVDINVAKKKQERGNISDRLDLDLDMRCTFCLAMGIGQCAIDTNLDIHSSLDSSETQ